MTQKVCGKIIDFIQLVAFTYKYDTCGLYWDDPSEDVIPGIVTLLYHFWQHNRITIERLAGLVVHVF